ncbi:hypothetical protein PG993_013857, partial [Apiospora rasikravindrae]
KCGTCQETFNDYWVRDCHVNATEHEWPELECDTCSRTFKSEVGRVNHMIDFDHFKFDCTWCGMTWPSRKMVIEHQHEDHYWCAACGMEFTNYDKLKQHLNSRIHQGPNIKCPFCRSPWATAGDMAHHLETGSCLVADRVNRDTLYKHMRKKDTDGIITKKLIEYDGSNQPRANEQSYNPPGCTYEATGGSYNPVHRRYECPLCHRLFYTLWLLNSHLHSSTRHQALYHCPNRGGCGEEFMSLADLIDHLGSGTCNFASIENVQREIQSVVSGNKLIML